MNIIQDLKQREILYAITNQETFLNLSNKNKKIYIGFDPTANSLHLGNYIQILTLLRFKKYGYTPYIILGGATSMIGDPSGKKSERPSISQNKIKSQKKIIMEQLKKFKIKIIDNYEFYKNINVLDFLHNNGKLLNINYMISKDIIKSRLKSGISFAEFSYQLLQGWDFYKLFNDYDIAIQIGGSDQWGNITSGLEIIRKKLGPNAHAVGITTQLLTNSSGQKFGKTSDNKQIWLDEKLTSSFEIYQYFINQDDKEIEKLLKWFTFHNLKKIAQIMMEHNKQPFKRIAQKELAKEVLNHIRGVEAYKNAQKITSILFNKFDPKKTMINEMDMISREITTISAKKIKISDAIVLLKLANSKSEAREFIRNEIISVNGQLIKDVNFLIEPNLFNKKYTLIKSGKKNNGLIKHLD